MALADTAYLTRKPYAVVVRLPSGNTTVYANFEQRDAAESFAVSLLKQGRRAFVKMDPRLDEAIEDKSAAIDAPARG